MKEERQRGREGDVGSKEEDDESMRGGRHTHGDEKQDTQCEGEEMSIFTGGW